MKNDSRNLYEYNSSSRGLRKGLLVAILAILLLALALLSAFLIYLGESEGLPVSSASFESADIEENRVESFSITLDTSAHPGATVAQDTLVTDYGENVQSLPFAQLEGMRFIGWFTAPEGAPEAIKIDNNSLDKLTLNTDQTLYAHFEVRPTAIDYENQGLPIMMYHYFYNPDAGECGSDANWMNIHLFESHLAYMQSNNYYFPTWEEVGAYIRGEILLPQPSIVLCSDDGDESFFRLAAPLLEKYDAKMTSFMVLIDLPPERLQEIDSSRVSIQSHSFDMHRGGIDGNARMLTASYQEIYDDALMAEQLLNNKLAYCYPYGKTNDTAKKALSDAGVGLALVIANERAYPLCDPMKVPRLRMNDGASVEYFAAVAY